MHKILSQLEVKVKYARTVDTRGIRAGAEHVSILGQEYFFFFFFFPSQTTRKGSFVFVSAARYYKNLCVKYNNYRKIETGRDIIALAIKFASP